MLRLVAFFGRSIGGGGLALTGAPSKMVHFRSKIFRPLAYSRGGGPQFPRPHLWAEPEVRKGGASTGLEVSSHGARIFLKIFLLAKNYMVKKRC